MSFTMRSSNPKADMEVNMSNVFKTGDKVENQGNPIVTSNNNFSFEEEGRASPSVEFKEPIITDANLSLNPYSSSSFSRNENKSPTTDDPYQAKNGSVLKYEEIFCYRILPIFAIIAASLVSVEVMYGDKKVKWHNDSEQEEVDHPTIRSPQQKHIVSGALAGAMSCGVVIYQYLTRPELKAYPNPLLLRQVLADLVVSCVLVALYMPINQEHTIVVIKEVVGGLAAAFIFFLLIQLREWLWLFNMTILVAVLLWLNRLQFDGSFLAPRSCIIPSVAFVMAFHMSIWRLPLISIDLYRTMINPFLEFQRSIKQYDIFLSFYLLVVAIVFIAVQNTYHMDLPDNCPILRDSESPDRCFGMSAAWTFGKEAGSTAQPKICFVPNRDGATTIQRQALWAYPGIWLYSVWAISIVITVALSWMAYRRLVAGTSESIIARLRIIVANFRNIFVQLCWMALVGILDILTYSSKSTIWPTLLVFCLFARGLVDLVCWFWINNDQGAVSNEGVNTALTKEMTGYLLRGLQKSAKGTESENEDPNLLKGFRIINLKEHGEQQDILVLTPKKFFRLVFGVQSCCNGDSSRAKKESALSQRKARMESRKSDRKSRFSTGATSTKAILNDPLRYFTRGSLSYSTTRDRNGSSIFNPSSSGKGMEGPYLMEYLPEVFRSVRNTYSVSEDAFMSAWGAGLELKLNEGGSSQAFFLFSTDKRFIVKSCTPKEMKLLRSMAPEYSQYLLNFPESFLVRIYGAYNLVVYGTSFEFFVMENLFYYKKDVPLMINERYDIKGSTVNRNFSEPKQGEYATCRLCSEKYVVGKKDKCAAHAQGTHIANVILKDCDLYSKFQISPDRAVHISAQLDRDSKFLLRRNIMDYSLLVGIHTKQVQVTWRSLYSDYEPNEGEWSHLLSQQTPTHSVDGGGVGPISESTEISARNTLRSQNMSSDSTSRHTKSRSVWLMQNNKEPTTQGQDCCIEASSIVGPFSYHIGIIDILQEWDWSKKLERFFKTTFLMKDAHGLSAVEPITYQDRFMVRIGGIMNLTEEGTVAGIVDTLPSTFPTQISQGSGLNGYVNDQGSYQDASNFQVNSPERHMTSEEYKEMRSSISTTTPSSVRGSSLSFQTQSHNTSQFDRTTTSSQFDGISSSHSLDIGISASDF